MPIGYVLAVGVAALGFVAAVRPLRRSGALGGISWFVSLVVNESPFFGLYWLAAISLLAWSQGDLAGPAGWLGLAVAVGAAAASVVLVRRSLTAGPVMQAALRDGLGPRWADAAPAGRPGRRPLLRWVRIVLAPLPVLAWDLRRTRNVRYGSAERHNLFDLYRARRRTPAGPVLIHLHGGHFRTGRKSFEGRPLLHRCARNGWLCISANYRLRPHASYADMLTDTKAVIAWAKANAERYGADPGCVFVSGSSAGAHLAVTAALTPNQAAFQAGFEQADTTVAAAVGFYGYYGPVDGGEAGPTAPGDYVHADAPPVLLLHGGNDTYVAPANPRALVARLRDAAAHPVVYAELPHAQHSFDLLHSVRYETVIDGVEDFAAWVRAQRRPRRSAAPSDR
ncbi:MAG: alpha/beta hydrolase [Acidimicrobiales bacterium]